jgi:hypothetical protein
MARKIKEAVENPPISEQTERGITFSIDDRKFLKAQNDLMVDFITEKMDENLRFIAEIVIASTNKMYSYMEEIKTRLDRIDNVLHDHEARIRCLENQFNKRA